MGSIDNKRAIVKAMAVLLADCSLDKLTVSDICAQAGVSRQTFYRAFEDKYAAVMWYVDGIVEATCRRIGKDIGWREGYLALFRIIESGNVFMRAVLGSDDYNSVFNTTIRSSEADFLRNYEQKTGRKPDELLAFQAKVFARTATECITEWVEGGCTPAADEFIDLFLTLVPKQLFDALDLPPSSGDAAFLPSFL